MGAMRRVLPLVIAACSLSACSSGSSGPLAIGPAQNHHSITVTKGQSMVVTLPGTTWAIGPDPGFGPLVEQSVQLSSGKSQSTTAVFKAAKTGTADIVGTKGSCSKAPCAPAFQVQVNVTG